MLLPMMALLSAAVVVVELVAMGIVRRIANISLDRIARSSAAVATVAPTVDVGEAFCWLDPVGDGRLL